MNGDEVLTALELPVESRVDQRVPKKLLLENGAATAADKRRINEGIEEFVWAAALKPATVGVPEYRDAVREYLEIAVLHVRLRGDAKAGRLVELIHRAVPYPVLLIAEAGNHIELSAAHKRWAHNEFGKTVLDDEIVAAAPDAAAEHWKAFRSALPLARQPQGTLYALYHGWIDTLLALRAACLTGTFSIAATPEAAAARRDALRASADLDAEIARLRTVAGNEKQLARRVELNLQVKRTEAAQAAARQKL